MQIILPLTEKFQLDSFLNFLKTSFVKDNFYQKAVDGKKTKLSFFDYLDDCKEHLDDIFMSDFVLQSKEIVGNMQYYQANRQVAISIQKRCSNEIHTLTCVYAMLNTPYLCLKSEIAYSLDQKSKTFDTKTIDSKLFPIYIPGLIQNLLWQGFGGLDGLWPVTAEPVFVQLQNVKQYRRTFKESMQNNKPMLPIVYIRPDNVMGSYQNIDVFDLATKLAGQAHVVVSANPFVANQLESNLLDTPVINGVRIFLPNGLIEDVDTNDMLSENIIAFVQKFVSQIYVPKELSLMQIQIRCLIQNDGELSDTFEELLSEKEKELTALNSECDSLKSQVYQLEHQLQSCKTALSSKSDGRLNDLQLNSEEKDLYDGERLDIILKVLQKELKSLDGDKNTKSCRKYDVLKDIIDHNALTGLDSDIREKFEKITKTGTFSAKDIPELERLGFVISSGGGCHWKVCFAGDARYAIAVSKTPSDHRSGANLQSTFMNLLFGY